MGTDKPYFMLRQSVATVILFISWLQRTPTAADRRGADINEKNNDGQTALFVAVGRGHLEAVNLLVENGADISEKSADGQTALFLADGG